MEWPVCSEGRGEGHPSMRGHGTEVGNSPWPGVIARWEELKQGMLGGRGGSKGWGGGGRIQKMAGSWSQRLWVPCQGIWAWQWEPLKLLSRSVVFNFSRYHKHSESLLKHKLLGPAPELLNR